MKHTFSQQMRNALKSTESLFRFFMTDSAYSRRKNDPGISNFVLGNPQEMPLPGFTEALQRWIVPQNKDWFVYKRNMPEAQAIVAASLRGPHRRGDPHPALWLSCQSQHPSAWPGTRWGLSPHRGRTGVPRRACPHRRRAAGLTHAYHKTPHEVID